MKDWKGLIIENDYSKHMIINFHIEGMNKPQLHRVQIKQSDVSTVLHISRLMVVV